jgi:hypothetical protein
MCYETFIHAHKMLVHIHANMDIYACTQTHIKEERVTKRKQDTFQYQRH